MIVNLFPIRNDKIPACKNWQTHTLTSKEVETMDKIGIAVPKGIFIIDVDLYKGVTLEAIECKLACKLTWKDAELQETPRGGKHYGFRVDNDLEMPQGSNLFDVAGFDTRSAGKGYIVSGEGYSDLTFCGIIETAGDDRDVLPILPETAIKMLRDATGTSRKKNVNCETKDLAEIIENKPLDDISINDVKRYVGRLSVGQAAEHDSWLHVGMAIYHQTEGSEEGWAIFDRFSKTAMHKYNLTINRKRWDSFGHGNVGGGSGHRIKFPTVIKMAGGRDRKIEYDVKKNDFDFKKLISDAVAIEDMDTVIKKIADAWLDPVTTDLLLKDIQAKYKILCGKSPTLSALKCGMRKLQRIERDGEFVKKYVFLTSCNQFMNIGNKSVMDSKGFNIAHNRETPFSGDNIPIGAVAYAEQTIRCVEDGMYAPMFGEFFKHCGLSYINLYKKRNIENFGTDETKKTNIVKRVIDHVGHILKSEIEQKIFIEYLAHNVQFPGRKIQWAIVLQGVQGDGKSFFSEMMQHVMGYQNVRLMNAETLEGTHTGWAGGQCMTFIEELKLDNYRKYSILNKLKPYIANPSVESRALYKNPRVIMNTTNYVAFSNYTDSLPIGSDDRRYCILFSKWQSREKLLEFMNDGANVNYYPSLYDDMRKNWKEILKWLMEYKISNEFLSYKNAPMTDSKQKMISESTSDNTLIVQDAIDKFDCEDINGDVVNITRLSKLVFENFDNDMRDFPKTAALKHSLRELGYHAVGRYKSDDRKNQRIYAKDLTKKAIDFKK